MNAKELKNLSRGDLLEMLILQTDRVERMEVELEEAKKKAEARDIMISKCGTLAEATMHINQVWKAADKAAAQYLSNILRMYDEQELQLLQARQEQLPAPAEGAVQTEAPMPADDGTLAEAQTKAQTKALTILAEAVRRSEAMIAETTAKCDAMEAQTRQNCDAMLQKAEEDAKAFMEDAYQKLEQYCAAQESLKALFGNKG